jgi:hypothetical protein
MGGTILLERRKEMWCDYALGDMVDLLTPDYVYANTLAAGEEMQVAVWLRDDQMDRINEHGVGPHRILNVVNPRNPSLVLENFSVPIAAKRVCRYVPLLNKKKEDEDTTYISPEGFRTDPEVWKKGKWLV